MDEHKKENVVGVSYKVINTAMESGDASPSTPIGINLPNNMHLFQTAERIRKDNLPDWMQLIGLIHDLGKILYFSLSIYLKHCSKNLFA